MKLFIFYLILGVLILVLYGSFKISLIDFDQKNVCPKLLSIPVCYIISLTFLLVIISHLNVNGSYSNFWYYIFLAIPFIMALTGTLNELSGNIVCPRTAGGTPMCYISLGFCISLFVLKLIEQRLKIRPI